MSQDEGREREVARIVYAACRAHEGRADGPSASEAARQIIDRLRTPTAEPEEVEHEDGGEPSNADLARWLRLHTEGRRAYPPSHPWYEITAQRLTAEPGEPVAWRVTITGPGDSGTAVFWHDEEPGESDMADGYTRTVTPLYAHLVPEPSEPVAKVRACGSDEMSGPYMDVEPLGDPLPVGTPLFARPVPEDQPDE